MTGCDIISKKSVIKSLGTACAESVKLGLSKGSLHIKQTIQDLVELSRKSPNPEESLAIVRDCLTQLYDTPNIYTKVLNMLLPKGAAFLLFNNNTNVSKLDDTVSSNFEEAVKSSRKIRLNNFLSTRFKNAPNARLYFERSIKNDLVETFLVSRSSELPKFFTTLSDMNKSVQAYKLQLLDRIFDYFDNDFFLKQQAAALNRTVYLDGNYTGVIESLQSYIDGKLSYKAFLNSNIKSLDDFYLDYRRYDKQAGRFLNAYNAWIMLNNFDTLVKDLFGTIVNIKELDFDKHSGDLTKYEIRNRASNMWRNWTSTDDIEDMSEVISDVTQALVNTSRMYHWGSAEAFPDRYLSFNDFNHIIGLIKKFAFDDISDNIILSNLEDIGKVSIHTKRILLDILSWNRLNGNGTISEINGSLLIIPKDVTFKQLVARLNENPQKYLHAIFDVICNTDILSNYQINDYLKNLYWSFYKEMFGGDGNNRSLFNLHMNTRHDNVYEIITQVAASTFPEEYLQYYELQNGAISTRMLLDYAKESIKRDIFDNIQQTAVLMSTSWYADNGITFFDRNNQPNLLNNIKIEIKYQDNLPPFTIDVTPDRINTSFYTNDLARQIWSNHRFKKLIKEVLGVDFDNDPDLENAYIEVTTNNQPNDYGSIVKNMSNLLGRVLFNSVVNTEYIPRNPKASEDASKLEAFVKALYGDKEASYNVGSKYGGNIPVLGSDVQDSYLKQLIQAKAINSNLLSQALSKTGEGTSIANYTLSRMRNFYLNLIEMLCKKLNSAVKDLTFVVNSNNVFKGIFSRREIKTLNSNQQSTKFSDKLSFLLAFINDFVAAYAPNSDKNAYLQNGIASLLPTVNSDKPQIDGLPVNLLAKTRIPNGKGGYKSYLELNDSEIELEMVSEFKDMYDKIITNINNELLKVYYELLRINSENVLKNIPPFKITPISDSGSVILKNQSLLDAINNAFKDRVDLGNNYKERITNGLHNLLTQYNKIHSRNPIMLSTLVHYIFDDEGLLTSNKTLEALWGRFNPKMDYEVRLRLNSLYDTEKEYLNFLNRNDLEDRHSTYSFFKYQDHLTVKDLLGMKFQVRLFGSDSLTRHKQAEILFLRGEAVFNEKQLNDPNYQHLIDLNAEMRNWISEDGFMIIAKGTINGKEVSITSESQLNEASDLRIHPMLGKLNRLDYLCTQQYTVATVGSHYVHKGKAKKAGSILVEESLRWLASNKRNVAATSTVHLFQNKSLFGSPSIYNIAIIEDIYFDLYNLMGDLYLEGHAPLDGGMFVNGFIPDLENYSLAGEAAGWDKKHFGTFYSEQYAAGGIIKTAGFAPNNSRMRRSKSWRNLQRNMSNKIWVKERPDLFGKDIPEIIDITKCDYLNQDIDYTQAIGGKPIYYKKLSHDNILEMATYKLHDIKSLGNNKYEIWEIEVDALGVEIGGPQLRKENGLTEITINTNWDLYTKVFGGWNSLEIGLNNKLIPSENSIKLMVYAINHIGYRKNLEYLKAEDFDLFRSEKDSMNTSDAIIKEHLTNINGLDQDDVWLPLKYSDIHFTPNIGAIKSLQFNVNPDGNAVLTSHTDLNFMQIRLALLGILLDKEHHADASDVSMPTLIIQATANRSYTSEYSEEIYNALAVLTRQVTEPFILGINDIINAENPSKLVEEVTNLIVDHLLHQSDEENSINAILGGLLEKAEKGETLLFAEDIQGKVAWSDPTISNKLFSTLSSVLTKLAIKMKFAGNLAVICPTEGVEQLYGNRLLTSFDPVYDNYESTRTKTPELNLKDYLNSVRDGREIDSDGRNMLIFDSVRDAIKRNEGEDDISYQKRVASEQLKLSLSRVSELKTLHNYIIEYDDATSDKVVINIPEEYYAVKNLILLGKKHNVTIDLLDVPLDYTTMSELDLAIYLLNLLNKYLKTPEQYLLYYQSVVNGSKKVVKIYENVETPRTLSAYNVRFSDEYGYRYLIYDLDSINLLFKLNNLVTDKKIKGYTQFQNQTPELQLLVLKLVFNSSAFKANAKYVWFDLTNKHQNIPAFNENFLQTIQVTYPDTWLDIINDLYKSAKPKIYRSLLKDLFKLSSNYTKPDRSVYVNGRLVNPFDIKTDAYELIMPKIYKTLFGLLEFDDLQEILNDRDFFLKRGLLRFKCKLDHSQYDYELKNFSGGHYYILDKTKGIPEEVAKSIIDIVPLKKHGKEYRVDYDNNILYLLSSEEDAVCKLNGVEIIVTDNPAFYILKLNYNTLKVSPKRVTEESYLDLTNKLSASNRTNSRNFLKAITNNNTYFSLDEFKKFNQALDDLSYDNVKAGALGDKEYKSLELICHILLRNGKELHTAFDESLNIIAGRIPAQSQLSFMTLRVVGFDTADLNTAMVSTFQLFLLGSDLDIDAVTLLGYEFDKNGKFVGWSPYFNSTSKDFLVASKNMPLPNGKIQEIQTEEKATTNFFEVYDKYFGTLFKVIKNQNTNKVITENTVPKLYLDYDTPEGMQLLAEFLRDFNKYGIAIKALVQDDVVIAEGDFYKAPQIQVGNTIVDRDWNLFRRTSEGGEIGARHEQTYLMARQLLDFGNTHNNYLNVADEHLRDKMSKNYIVHYIYKVSEAACNLTEAGKSIDTSTEVWGDEAKKSALGEAANSHAPGRVSSKVKLIGEGLAGKDGVGIGAVGIKANSTTLFYLSQIINYGSDEDKKKLLFKKPVTIGDKTYRAFANMFTNKFTKQDLQKWEDAFNYIDTIDDPTLCLDNVAEKIASMLSIAVDNAKGLILAKINAGPRLMGMYIYGLTLGVPAETLSKLLRSEQGMLLKEMSEGSVFDNDSSAFKVIDVFSKLEGNIGSDISKFNCFCLDGDKNIVLYRSKIKIKNSNLNIKTPTDALFASMYQAYTEWFEENKKGLPREFGKEPTLATTFVGMLRHLMYKNAFNLIYVKSKPGLQLFIENTLLKVGDPMSIKNWVASKDLLVSFIQDMENKGKLMRSKIGKDLKTLALGAEEMRILGSILSSNKGLKTAMVDALSFIETIENLIYDRKLLLGQNPTDDDKIDFMKFMTDKEYQNIIADKYELVKHSVNIPHLLTKVPHFRGYLETALIPDTFYKTVSIKYRTLLKYRKHAHTSFNKNISLFSLLGIESSKDQSSALKGLENLIHYEIFTNWCQNIKFKIPAKFRYFTNTGTLAKESDLEETISLNTSAGLATFKKYMEEIIIPDLIKSPNYPDNTFVRNLRKISYNLTPTHRTVSLYSLPGDLMAKKGRDGELNAKMSADFLKLAEVSFLLDIPTLADAFYIYALYCFNGKKGKKSLMGMFDSGVSSMSKKFTDFEASLELEGQLDLELEKLIAWCAPIVNSRSTAAFGYNIGNNELEYSLKKKIINTKQSDDDFLYYDSDQQDNKPKKGYTVYKQYHLSSHYDKLTKNNFLVPMTSDNFAERHYSVIKPEIGQNASIDISMNEGTITNVSLSNSLKEYVLNFISLLGESYTYKNVEEFERSLFADLKDITLPYTVLSESKAIDLDIVQEIFNIKLYC